MKSDSTISSFHTVIHTATTDTISDKNCTSSYHRQEYTGAILHISAGRQTLYCTKF